MHLSSAQATRGYEQLDGAEGRAVFHRPPRFRPRALAAQLPLVLGVAGQRVRLHDLSATGLSYWVSEGACRPSPGTRLPVRLTLGDADLLSCEARVVRDEPAGHRVLVGLCLIDQRLSPRAIQRLHDRLSFEQSVKQGLSRFQAVPPVYRNACNELLVTTQHWAGLLDGRERALAQLSPERRMRELAQLEALAAEPLRRDWSERIRGAAEAAASVTDPEALAAAKLYTELCTAPAVQRSPFWSRCLDKPLGYPGDYIAMSWMYERVSRADTVFGRLLDAVGLDHPLSRSIPDRGRFLVDELRGCSARVPRGERVRIMTIGAGPAQEIVDFLSTTPAGAELDFLLVDQDLQALDFAYERVCEAARPHGERVSVRCLHLSFRRLFSRPDLLGAVADMSLIYAAGLFDYLRELTARVLIDDCFARLRSGGRLVVGNAARAPHIHWLPEFMLDWTLLYRSADEMRGLAAPLENHAEVGLGADATGTWWFLSATRRRP